MNWFLTQTPVLNTAGHVVDYAANWLLQSTILIAAGLTIARLLQTRGSAVQSAIHRTTLVSVLACPVATALLTFCGVSAGSVSVPRPWAHESQTAISVGADKRESQPAAQESLAIEPCDLNAAAQITTSDNMSRSPVGATDYATQAAAPPPTPRPSETHWISLMVLTASISWLMLSTVMLVRLAIAWRRLVSLRRNGTGGEPMTVRLCRQLASRMGVAEPEVLRSPFLRGPFLVGLCRPAILLPENEFGESVRDTLIHELAHLRRRDCHWNLLQQLALSVYLFQPLLWVLSRRLELSAEEVCDDCVVQLGSDREGYANRLVRIAELSAPPLALATVGIVSLRSQLARRIGRIMDTSRPLSTKAGSLLLTLTIIGGLTGATCVGLIGTGPRSTLAASTASADETTSDGKANTRADTLDKTRGEGRVAVHGRIVGAHGRPLAAAHVAAIGGRIQADRGGELQPRGEVLAEAKTDENGKYALSLQGVFSKAHRDARVIARIDGWAMAWQTLNLDAADTEISLKLPAEEVIRGRLVDSQGAPAADVRLVASSVEKRSPAQESIGFDVGMVVPAAWLPPVASDGEGRFTLHGIPTGYGVHLRVQGSERFAPQFILLNTGASEKRGKRDGTYRALVKNFEPGEEAILALAPAQLFEGVVRYADTGEPAPHARLTIWASQQAPFGSMISVGNRSPVGVLMFWLVWTRN